MHAVVLLDRIRSMHNVGAFFRTCDGVGVKKLILTGYTAYPPRPQIAKTALDADSIVPWEYWKNPIDATLHLKEEGYILVAVEKNETSKHYREVAYTQDDRVCFIFGNEVEGVSHELLALVDVVVHLPMYGHKESLNVSVAGGALLYHYLGGYGEI